MIVEYQSSSDLFSRCHCAVSMATSLYTVAVHSGSACISEAAVSRLLSTVVVDVFKIERVDVARDIAKQGQADVDEEVSTASGNGPDADRREEDGDENEQNS